MQLIRQILLILSKKYLLFEEGWKMGLSLIRNREDDMFLDKRMRKEVADENKAENGLLERGKVLG